MKLELAKGDLLLVTRVDLGWEADLLKDLEMDEPYLKSWFHGGGDKKARVVKTCCLMTTSPSLPSQLLNLIPLRLVSVAGSENPTHSNMSDKKGNHRHTTDTAITIAKRIRRMTEKS